MDSIIINRLKVKCIIGCNPEERVNEQDLFISVDMHADTRKAGTSDNLDDTVNYSAVSKQIAAIAIDGKFKLIEALAHSIAQHCLRDPRITSVTVTIEKPAALLMADATIVRITRP